MDHLNDKVQDTKTKYYQDVLLLERYRPSYCKAKTCPSLRLHRLQMGAVLLRHLFPTRPSEEKDEFGALVKTLTDCSLEQLSKLERIQHLQKQLEAIQQERVAVMGKCRQLSADMEVISAYFCDVMTLCWFSQTSSLQYTSK